MPSVFCALYWRRFFFRYDLSSALYQYLDKNYYLSEVNAVAADTRVDVDLLLAVINVESKFNPGAVSSKGAVGLMQIMPATAAEIAQRNKIPYADSDVLKKPSQNIRLGALYLKSMIKIFGDTQLAVGAYNCGPGKMQEWIGSIEGEPNVERFPIDETRHYMIDVEQSYRRLQRFRQLCNTAKEWDQTIVKKMSGN
ncbi:MAG: lytic transglycosylase domain-containing protein [Candidatus Lindowbacteria bacterium]|nr:lytic transglycosylase domain-containing protein [Candidatus Lindowbacteria bacterium]